MSEFDTIRDLMEGNADKKFLDNQIHKKARDDFRYLASQLGFTVLNNIDYQTVKTHDKEFGDFLVVGLEMAKGTVEFPKRLLDAGKENLYVAVVGYKDSAVVDVYAFKATEFAKVGLFSMYKYNKKTDMYGITMPSGEKLQKYSFGYVIKA